MKELLDALQEVYYTAYSYRTWSQNVNELKKQDSATKLDAALKKVTTILNEHPELHIFPHESFSLMPTLPPGCSYPKCGCLDGFCQAPGAR